MTKREAVRMVRSIYNTAYPEMTPEETCDALEALCQVLEWLIGKLPEETE